MRKERKTSEENKENSTLLYNKAQRSLFDMKQKYTDIVSSKTET